jgi:quercetin dioxygenase-like cupin family protein
MHKTSWKEIAAERVGELISRQAVNGENATVGRFLFGRGAVIPRHFHANEQYSLVLSGSLRFVFDDSEVVVSAGEMLFIPGHVPHSVVAVEDTEDVDFFAPRREDWIRKEDSHLRQNQTAAKAVQT